MTSRRAVLLVAVAIGVGVYAAHDWLGVAVYVAVLGLVWRMVRPLRRRRPAYVPSHSPGYDELHRSHYWRVELNALVYERSGGRCEARWCRKRRGLQKHLLSYECLDGYPVSHRRPRLDEIEHLCPEHHHVADDKRRARERSMRRREGRTEGSGSRRAGRRRSSSRRTPRRTTR